MYFAHPGFLLLGLLVFLPLMFPRVRRAIPISAVMVVRELTLERVLRVVWRSSEGVVWVGAVLLTALIIAWPQKTVSHFTRSIQIRKICLVADVSTSMSGEGITRSKKILHDFVDKRKGDWMCLVAYSGSSGQEGGAGVIQPLTPHIALMHHAIDRLEPTMFGSHTAIGEGIWTATWAFQERELRMLEERNIWVDLEKIRSDLRGGDRKYTEQILRLLGKKGNEIMVLFTDGFYNTGIPPSAVFPIVEARGIKMYIAVLDPTGATGLTKETAYKRRDELKQGAKRTGGGFFMGENYDEVAAIYTKVDKIEKQGLTVEMGEVEQEVYHIFIPFLPFLVGWFILMKSLFLRIRGERG